MLQNHITKMRPFQCAFLSLSLLQRAALCICMIWVEFPCKTAKGTLLVSVFLPVVFMLLLFSSGKPTTGPGTEISCPFCSHQVVAVSSVQVLGTGVYYQGMSALPLGCPFFTGVPQRNPPIVWQEGRITESQNQLGRRRPLNVLSPTFDWTPPCQPDHGTDCCIQSFLKHLQGQSVENVENISPLFILKQKGWSRCF